MRNETPCECPGRRLVLRNRPTTEIVNHENARGGRFMVRRGQLVALGLALPPPVQLPPQSTCRSPGCACMATGRCSPATARSPQTESLPRRSARWRHRDLGPGLSCGAADAVAILRLKRALGDLDRVTAWLRVSGQFRAGLRSLSRRHQRFLRLDHRALRRRARRSRALRDRGRRTAVRHACRNRGGGRDRLSVCGFIYLSNRWMTSKFHLFRA